MKNYKISDNVIRRLPRYLRLLDEIIADGTKRISSGEMASLMGLTASQIRQDFNCFGGFGQQGYGYNTEMLREAVASIMGLNNGYTAVIVGVGNLGHALLRNFDFGSCGFELKAAFDVNANLVGDTMAGIPIYDSNGLVDYIKENDIDLALLSVPKTTAKPMAEKLCSIPIKAIWNFTNVELTAPGSDTLIESIHFSDSLMTLGYYLNGHREDHN